MLDSPSLIEGIFEILVFLFYSGAPASWCQKHWIHWRCLFSAFRVEAQLRELIRKLKQVIAIMAFFLSSILARPSEYQNHVNYKVLVWLV